MDDERQELGVDRFEMFLLNCVLLRRSGKMLDEKLGALHWIYRALLRSMLAAEVATVDAFWDADDALVVVE